MKFLHWAALASVLVVAQSHAVITGNVFQDFNGNGIKNTTGCVNLSTGDDVAATTATRMIDGAWGRDGRTLYCANTTATRIAPASIDEGLGGVTVNAYDATGALCAATTTDTAAATLGNYTLALTGGSAGGNPGACSSTSVRLEFLPPTGYTPSARSAPSVNSSGLSGTSPRAGSTTQFVADGQTNVNLALMKECDYCQNNPTIAITRLEEVQTTTTGRALQTFPLVNAAELDGNINGTVVGNTGAGAANAIAYTPARPVPTTIGTREGLGSTFGLVYNRRTKQLYSSAFLKRQIPYGTVSGQSTGAIFATNPVTGASTVFADLNMLVAANIAGVNTHPVPATNFGIAFPDPDSVPLVGKSSLGGLALSLDRTKLYSMNLANRTIYALGVPANGGPATTYTAHQFPVANWPIADGLGTTCPAADLRPFALSTHPVTGVLYVGGVCSGESISDPDPNAAAATVINAQPNLGAKYLRAYVWTFDPATNAATLVLNGALNYDRDNRSTGEGYNTDEQGAGTGDTIDWEPWFSRFGNVNEYARQHQPMLTDLTFDRRGNMTIALRERVADQADGSHNLTQGDILMACRSSSGSPLPFVFENNGTCNGSDGSANRENVALLSAVDGYGPGGAEYYADWRGDAGRSAAVGGLIQIPGFRFVISSATDAVIQDNDGTRVGNPNAYGIQLYNTTTGMLEGAYDVQTPFPTADARGSVGKRGALGDIEALCDLPPIEIGNRVWRDSNRNGVQDPGEPPISGVTVKLFAANGTTLLGTAVTDANGEYYFVSGTVADANLTDHIGVVFDTVNAPNGILPDTGYVLRIESAQGASQQSSLSGLVLTAQNASRAGVAGAGDASNNPNADWYDSDAALNTAAPTSADIVFTTGPAGSNNHTLDFGFGPPLFAIGNRIWFDTNNNGAIDAAESPIDGVLVELTNSAGAKLYRTSATDTTATTTNTGLPYEQTSTNGGYYLFDGLPAGTYRVRVAASNWGTGQPLAGYASSSGATNAGSSFATADNNRDHGTDPASAAAYVSSGVSSADINLGAPTVGTGDTTETGAPTGTPPTSALGDASDNRTIDFGFYRLSVGNLVWSDSGVGSGGVRNDGIQNGGELGIANVTVQLLDSSNNVIAQTRTDSNGNYRFNQGSSAPVDGSAGVGNGQPILPGNYTVRIPQATSGGVNAALVGSTSSADPAGGGLPIGDARDNGTGTAQASAVNVNTSTIALAANTGTGVTVTNSTGTTNQPRVDMGFVPPLFAIGNRIWLDTNNNGVVDAGEAMIPNVLVELLDSSSAVVATTATSATGEYVFDNLAAGTYTVRVAKENWLSSGITAAQVTAAGSPSGLVAGTKPLAGYANSGATSAANGATATDAADKGINPATAAAYLTAGVLSDAITLGAGLQPTGESTATDNDGASATTATDANNNLTVDFGFYALSVGNLVWTDTDNSGTLNAGEAGLNGVVLQLLDSTNTVVATTTTAGAGAAAGSYLFTQGTNAAGVGNGQPLLPGNYTVRVASGVPAGFQSSTPTTGEVPLTADNDDAGIGAGSTPTSAAFALAAGTNTGTGAVATNADGRTDQPRVDFGFAPIPVVYALGNRIWLDTNGDGIRQASELGRDGVVVNLLNGTGQPLYRQADGSIGTTVTVNPITTTTAGGGYYRFDGLPAGDYVVQVAPVNFQPSGALYSTSAGVPLAATSPNVGGVDGIDNNSNGLIDANPAANGIRSTPVTLGNGSGSEEPLGEADLGPGGQGSADNRADMTVDFGFVSTTFALGNIVFVDTNNNGIKDSGETGIGAGVTVNLYADANGDGVPDGALVRTTSTNADGQYLFSDLPAGRYVVEITGAPLAGYTSSTGINGSTTGPYEPGSTDFTAAGNDRDHGRNVSPGVIRSGTVTLGAAMPTGEGADLTVTDPNATPDNRTNLTVDFGVFRPASIGTVVWIDNGAGGGISGDGVKQLGEPGIPGVIVRLLDGSGNPVDGDPATPGVQPITTTTGPNGEYSFTNLIPGAYQVEFVFPAEARIVNTVNPAGAGAPGTGTDNQRNEMNPSTRRTPTITLAGGDNNPNLDSGVLSFDTTPAVIPTLSEWSKLLLAVLMLGVAWMSVRRRRAHEHR
jgi:hypothetical protein